MPKNTTVDLLQYLCQYKSSKKKGHKPDYLIPFLNFATENMTSYNAQVASGANPDWRIKEALLFAVGSLSEIIYMHKDIK